MTDDEPCQAIRVLVFSSLYPHEGEPTLGVFVRNRLQHLTKDTGVKATVIAPVPWFPFKSKMFGRYGRAARASRQSVDDGIQVYHPRFLVIPKVGMHLTPFFMAWSAKRLLKKIRKGGATFDLIDAHYLYPDGVAAAMLADWFKLPFIVTARGSDVTQIGAITSARNKIVHVCHSAQHVITVSQSLKDRLVEMGVDADHVTSLRNGIDADRFSPVKDARLVVCNETGLDAAKEIVVFAGWLIPRKRVDLVIEAIAMLPDVQGLIIGDGPLKSALFERVEELQLTDRVTFVGQKSPEDMPKYLSAGDVFCLPSEREGWANVMLESMACGVPVVARGVDGAVELIQQDNVGRLVEGDDPANYAAALRSVLDMNSDKAGVREYAKRFGWQATSLGQLALFKKALHPNDLEQDENGEV